MLKFWSNISLVFKIAIAVGAVILFSYFDPFGLFHSKKLKLEQTPVSVRSIREIGQLISAEYYGEVLTSLHEALITDIKESETSDEEEFENLKELYAESIQEFYDNKNTFRLGAINKGNKLYDLFYHNYPLLTEHPYYQVFIKSVITQLKKKNERKLLKEINKMKTKEFDDFLTKDYKKVKTTLIKAAKTKELEVLTADKKFRKTQIVVLGRGSVKAGIDFNAFTGENFKYDLVTKTIHLIGLKPEILTSDINPWFIPERKIKGFEIVVMTKKANNPKYMLKVKEMALKKR